MKHPMLAKVLLAGLTGLGHRRGDLPQGLPLLHLDDPHRLGRTALASGDGGAAEDDEGRDDEDREEHRHDQPATTCQSHCRRSGAWGAAGPAGSVGLGLAVVCLLLAGMLRAEWAYVAGYLVQVAAIGLGFVVPVMFGLGLVFAALWTGADLLGRKIERERAAAWAAYRAEQG